MDTPILDFLRQYSEHDWVRFHMPGHKGKGMLGCEKWDITEVYGGDALYEADGIIAKSERNAAELFGTQRTCYSTEGSSQCIRAMLYLALNNRPKGNSNVIVAARNVHKTFVYAAALLDIEPVWLWPESSSSLCGCPVTPAILKETLNKLDAPPAAVYVTSPDYLGEMADMGNLAKVCHDSGTILLVDNAHGAYLKFLPKSLDPLDLGADMCCASAHKTLPVLTGGAYLHISRCLPARYADQAKSALALFGSTSPSYLIMASLDACNSLLAGDYPKRIAEWAGNMDCLKRRLGSRGWKVPQSDPLRLTVRATESMRGTDIAKLLRGGEYRVRACGRRLRGTHDYAQQYFRRAAQAGKSAWRVPQQTSRARAAAHCQGGKGYVGPGGVFPAPRGDTGKRGIGPYMRRSCRVLPPLRYPLRCPARG